MAVVKKRKYMGYKTPKDRFEHNSGETETIPGQGMTAKEVLKRYASGLSEYERSPIYDEYADIDQPDILRNPAADLVMIHEEKMRLEMLIEDKKAEYLRLKEAEASEEESDEASAEEDEGSGTELAE